MVNFGNLAVSAQHNGRELTQGGSQELCDFVASAASIKLDALGSVAVDPKVFEELLAKVDDTKSLDTFDGFIRHWLVWFGAYASLDANHPLPAHLMNVLTVLTKGNPTDASGNVIDGSRYDTLALNCLGHQLIIRGLSREIAGKRCLELAKAVNSDWTPRFSN